MNVNINPVSNTVSVNLFGIICDLKSIINAFRSIGIKNINLIVSIVNPLKYSKTIYAIELIIINKYFGLAFLNIP